MPAEMSIGWNDVGPTAPDAVLAKMDRRTFIGRIAFGAFGPTLAVYAQETARIRHIAFLREGVQPIPQPLVQAMRDLGWVEGQNVSFESRYADNLDQLPDLAADLVRRKVDLIITAGTGAARAAKQATADIPIVFSVGGDPVERGLVGTMSRPGGNLTGFALGIYDEKQLQVLKAALPEISRVAYPVFAGANPSNLVNLDTAKAIGVQIQHVAVQTPDDFALFYSGARQAGADAALIPDVARLTPHLKRIGMDVSKSRLPAIGFRRIFAESGGLLSYGPTLSEMDVRMGIQIDKILRGAKPADLPVEQPTRFELVINLREAKALGVSIPRLVRLGADELIQ
jgi:putative tryptophan/tyrosine transport system substrate-binding protein